MNKVKNPKLRFPEFSWEWEERKLEDLITPISRKISKPDFKYLALWLRSHFKWIFHKPNSDPNKISMTELYEVKENDLVVNITFAWEWAVAIADKKDEWWLVSHRFPTYEFWKDLYVNFFRFVFPTQKTKYKLWSISPWWAWRNKVMNKKDFLLLNFNIPSIKEQQKIANFLSLIDKKIDKIRTKKEQLERYKKWIMQKIFSQEIRFKDENGKDFEDWESKELWKIWEFQTSSVDKLIKDWEKEVFLVNYMNVYRHETINNITKKYLQKVTAKDSQIESNNLKKWDILFTPSSETPHDIWHSVVIFEDLNNTVYSYHLMRFRPFKDDLDIKYSHYFCNTPEILSWLARLATWSTRFTISKSAFSSIKVCFPSNKKEQTKIADFLSKIDGKIEKETKKLEKSEEFKKGLLQQMFI